MCYRLGKRARAAVMALAEELNLGVIRSSSFDNHIRQAQGELPNGVRYYRRGSQLYILWERQTARQLQLALDACVLAFTTCKIYLVSEVQSGDMVYEPTLFSPELWSGELLKRAVDEAFLKRLLDTPYAEK